MKLREFSLLVDQNVGAELVAHLRNNGFDVLELSQVGMTAATDEEILAKANTEGRVVITHDSDFGSLAVQAAAPFIGIVYLRPGHISSAENIDAMNQLLNSEPDLNPRFVIVVKRTKNQVTIRVRQSAP